MALLDEPITCVLVTLIVDQHVKLVIVEAEVRHDRPGLLGSRILQSFADVIGELSTMPPPMCRD
jgi:hypothetical protein